MSSVGRLMDIARRALFAQQVGLNTTGHNIANVNTPGYTRQRVVLEPTKSLRESYGFVGQGVSIQTVERIRNEFTDLEINFEKQELEKWRFKEDYLAQIESIFNEPSDSGLSTVLYDFWDSWEEVANDPQSWAARERLKHGGILLTNTLHYMHKRLTELQSHLDEEFQMRIYEINSLLDRIATLNTRITSSSYKGITPNEYKDKRNLLLEQLSELVDVRYTENEIGALTISLHGRILVERNSVYKLDTKTRSLGYSVVHDPIWAMDGSDIRITSGRLKGLMDVRDEVIDEEINNLDKLAEAIVTEVNAIHKTGYGLDGTIDNEFFDSNYTDSANITLSPFILGDLKKIAASEDGTPGNGGIALQISELKSEKVMESNTSSIDGYFESMIVSLGVRSQEAKFMRENQELMVEHLENQRDSVSGVSLDEEMINIVKYQHAYEAAAKLITTVDEMMETIINMV